MATTWRLSDTLAEVTEDLLDHLTRFLWTRDLVVEGELLAESASFHAARGVGDVLEVSCEVEVFCAHRDGEVVLLLAARPGVEHDWAFGQRLPLVVPETVDLGFLREADAFYLCDAELVGPDSSAGEKVPPLWTFFYASPGAPDDLRDELADGIDARNGDVSWLTWAAEFDVAPDDLDGRRCLALWGFLGVHPVFAHLEEFIGSTGLLDRRFVARVGYDEEGDDPFLEVGLPLTDRPHSIGPIELTDPAIRLRAPLYQVPKPSLVGLDATFDFGERLRLRMTAEVELEDAIRAKATLEPGSDPLVDLDALGLSGATLGSSVELEFSRSERTLTSVRARAAASDLRLLEEPLPLTLTEAEIDLSILDPLGDRLLVGSVVATATLGQPGKELTLTAEGTVPNGLFRLRLSTAPTATLRELVTEFGAGDAAVALPDGLTLDELTFEAYFDTNRTVATIAVGGAWRITDGLELAGLTMHVVHRKSTSVAVSTRLAFPRAGVGFGLEASFGAGAWRFVGTVDGDGGDAIPIGDLVADLVDRFGVDAQDALPPALVGATARDVRLEFESDGDGGKEIRCGCAVRIPLGEGDDATELDIGLVIEIEKADQKTSLRFEGVVDLSEPEMRFAVLFSSDEAQKAMAGVFHSDDGARLDVADVVRGFIPSLPALPSVAVELRDVWFVATRAAGKSALMVGASIGAGIDLSKLPLVGPAFGADRAVRIDELQVVFASAAVDLEPLESALASETVTIPLPRPDDGPDGATELAKGMHFSGSIDLGGTSRELTLPLGGGGENGAGGGDAVAAPATPPAPAGDDGARWFAVQKALGPVYLERVGVGFADEVLTFLLDGALSAGDFSLILEGLAVGSRLDRFEPTFDLKGLGLQYAGGPLEITGAFLRSVAVTPDGRPYDAFSGLATLRSKALTLSAIGSYAELDGDPSLFIFAVLDYPLGGPSFFFVTGLAAGFGYNRTIVPPAIDAVKEFPLVSRATQPPAKAPTGESVADRVMNELTAIQETIPPSIGDYFLAVGIKFTSFKVLDSFLLLIASFGSRFQIDILGLSTLVLPPDRKPGTPPIAEIQLALKGTFQPEDGFVGVSAQLTPASYVFSRDCKLGGGFAFYSWFGDSEHEGDFVLSIGGYHPKFPVPSHYPSVPRLSMNWKIDEHLSIGGEAYFALTPSAAMAGGLLEANYRDGGIHAWFRAGADFLVMWKPLYYDIRLFFEIGVSYTFELFGTQTLTLELGADLQIWGPEFSGHAAIEVYFVTFEVDFGAGEDGEPDALDWPTFRESFLPDAKDVPVNGAEGSDKAILSAQVAGGLVQSLDAAGDDGVIELGVVNPKELSIVTNSVIPVTAPRIRDVPRDLSKSGDVGRPGIGPMNLAELTSTLDVSITKVDGEDEKVEDQFRFEPVFKNAPAALWGSKFKSDLGDDAVVPRTFAGFRVEPLEPPAPGTTRPVDRQALMGFDSAPLNDRLLWPPDASTDAAPVASLDAATMHAAVEAGGAAELARELGFDFTPNPSEEYFEVLNVARQPAVAS